MYLIAFPLLLVPYALYNMVAAACCAIGCWRLPKSVLHSTSLVRW